METKGYNAISIANYFIKLSIEKNGFGLYLLPLIKLPYIAHGFTLALTENPLCFESVEVWQYGPVYSNIYHAFKGRPSPKQCLEGGTTPEFKKTEERIMKHTFKIYGCLSSIELSAITHQPGTPWSNAKREKKTYIEDEDIKIYYKNLLKDIVL